MEYQAFAMGFACGVVALLVVLTAAASWAAPSLDEATEALEVEHL